MNPQMTLQRTSREDLFLSTRILSAETRFQASQEENRAAISYNDRLSRHWKPGIPTRSLALDAVEKGVFLRLLSLEVGASRGRPAWNPLVLDLGGGTGKVMDWLAALESARGADLSYVYTDFSPGMKAWAAKAFAGIRRNAGAAPFRAYFGLADVTQPLFSPEDWDLLRERYHPIIAVCAGGTIGNFGPLQARDDQAQRGIIRDYFLPADLALVTFLDAGRIERSLKAYAAFSRRAGLYDGQSVSLYSGGCDGPGNAVEFSVSFSPEQFRRGLSRARRHLSGLSDGRFWIRLEMLSRGVPVGQVTRHFSRHYARALLADFRVPLRATCDRAVVLGCRPRRWDS